MTPVGGAASLGLQRARELLAPEASAVGDRPHAAEHGYLDLVPENLESTGATQHLMTTSLVPAIYERYWRPALARVVKGLTGPGMAEEIRIARLLLGLGPGDVVLDVACGPGTFSREFARAVGDEGLVIGVDASRTMLERGAAEVAESQLENLPLIRGNATELPLRDGTFDAVCCFAALHLFADPRAGLDEMQRVLRPGDALR